MKNEVKGLEEKKVKKLKYISRTSWLLMSL